VHDEGFSQIVNRYRREAIAHKAIYPEQSLDAGSAIRLCLSNIARDLGAARRRGELATHFADIVAFRTAQFYGSLQGFSQSGPVTEALKRRFYYPPSATGSVGDLAQRGNAIDYDSVLERR
jgi:rhamnosyltransferase